MKLDDFKVGKKFDRRIKLSDEQRQEIKRLYFTERRPIRKIAKQFEGFCSRRLIQFILFPERDKRLKKIVRQEKRHLLYYDREKHSQAIRRLRQHKRQIIDNLMT